MWNRQIDHSMPKNKQNPSSALQPSSGESITVKLPFLGSWLQFEKLQFLLTENQTVFIELHDRKIKTSDQSVQVSDLTLEILVFEIYKHNSKYCYYNYIILYELLLIIIQIKVECLCIGLMFFHDYYAMSTRHIQCLNIEISLR